MLGYGVDQVEHLLAESANKGVIDVVHDEVVPVLLKHEK